MERWLTENKYICGKEKSIADLQAACELDQINYLVDRYNLAEKYPKTNAWLAHMIDECPVMSKVHTVTRKLAAVSVKNQMAKL